MGHNSILIIGESGTGKSTSIRSLNPSTTFIINTINKPFPFKGGQENYKIATKENPEGNVFATDNASTILRVIDKINKNRPDVQTMIIDDFQYIMSNEFMRRALEKGFDKFSEIGQNAWAIINALNACRDNLATIVLSHSEINETTGKAKCKTIGRMIDDKVCLEGMFTVVLQSVIVDGQYKFMTQHDGTSIAKSPLGMFDSKFIPNDLETVLNAVRNY